ncbi:type VII secretion protein EsxR [Nocardia huaxiensis]|uniref:Type VII secretion protein EsxR n=1 Tax=Nocardia huaxiensis TaxID=2755382 RepID=A0A7D6VDH4_9NOCA|nr:type VII secretion protein EsxR [Nocardia huaxiensis]QLY31862.1 type VII secretion protein EsxR [Nocardia huaxiensis]UFS95426.1 type VII secretion protein EsxR [Nocardia huaxiensis]
MGVNDPDYMEYDQGQMLTLFSDLQGFRQALTDRGQEMNDAATTLAAAWADNGALGVFQSTKGEWDGEFTDTLVILDKIAAEVENALHRALGTDGKIGDGFADI